MSPNPERVFWSNWSRQFFPKATESESIQPDAALADISTADIERSVKRMLRELTRRTIAERKGE